MRTAVAALLLLAALAAVPAARAGEVAADPLPGLKAGKETFEKSCRLCHSLERAFEQRRTAAEWEAVVARMAKNGAPVDAEKRARVVAYLAARSLFERRCTGCHGAERALATARPPREWEKVVKRMAEKLPEGIDGGERAQIAAYLALERPAN